MGDDIKIELIRELCSARKLRWTNHIMERLEERGIYASDIRHCIMSGEIIEQYPTDYPFPSCLILGVTVNNNCIHTVVGVGNGLLWLVTAYIPTSAKWLSDNKTRRNTQL